ncbi:MAG: shikimate kinase [Coriobacteriia bacterium]|nr:shikimate kinase [Coriobacteriia bacterium]
MSSVFLIGFMGAGKTTVGRMVAERLGLPFIDLDELVERREESTVAAIFEGLGEHGFRAAERAALLAVAAGPEAVVACGGGVVTDTDSRTLLSRSGAVVYLRVSPDEALARIGTESAGRPLLRAADPAAVAALLGAREALYVAAADFGVETVGRTPAEITDDVVAGLGAAA